MDHIEPLEISIAPRLVMRGRRYAGGEKTPALCIHGLTRNDRDFEELAPKLAATGRDVIALSLRGRGASDYDPDYRNYNPLTYRDDMLRALDCLGVDDAVFVGTSLGGIVTMLANEASPARVKAAALNDVGPELALEGVARIAAYVGESVGPAATLEEAARRIKAVNQAAFPDAQDDYWLAFARRTFRKTDQGWVLDYDPNIAKALAELGPAPDLWAAFESLKDTPTLVIRGALSDLLTPPIIEKMRAVHSHFAYVEISGVGHAPMMTEQAAWAAIEAFLSRLDRRR